MTPQSQTAICLKLFDDGQLLEKNAGKGLSMNLMQQSFDASLKITHPASLPRQSLSGSTKKALQGLVVRDGVKSTINGNRQRGTGLLNNELYVGRLVWNRLRYMKDPETGKRVSKAKP